VFFGHTRGRAIDFSCSIDDLRAVVYQLYDIRGKAKYCQGIHCGGCCCCGTVYTSSGCWEPKIAASKDGETGDVGRRREEAFVMLFLGAAAALGIVFREPPCRSYMQVGSPANRPESRVKMQYVELLSGKKLKK
jgi:hypothetical protein